MRIGIREFKTRATELVRLVESGGETVVITRHSRPVAMLVGSGQPEEMSEEQRRAKLAALRIIRRGSKRGSGRSWRPVRVAGRPLSEIILEERGDRL